MLLASLIDAGLEDGTMREKLRALPVLSGVSFETKRVKRGFLSATRLAIDLPRDQAHRSLSDVRTIVEKATEAGALKDAVASRVIETFTRLAEAEAMVHGTGVEDVHFHEVGALDAIVDVVGFYIAVDLLGVDRMCYTKLVLGSGFTKCLHGEIPLPAPATLQLLSGHEVIFSGRNEELITPTAAAIIANSFEPLSTRAGFVCESVGYGAGTRETDGPPNVLRVLLGRGHESPPRVTIIRTTIDDMNPEVYGSLMDQLFERGVLDVYYHPVMMKKNRPGLEITVTTEEADERRIADFLLANTTTLGVRLSREERCELPRRKESVETELGEAQVKIGTLPDGSERMSPEFESCKALAQKAGLPVIEVFDVVRRAWEKRRKRN